MDSLYSWNHGHSSFSLLQQHLCSSELVVLVVFQSKQLSQWRESRFRPVVPLLFFIIKHRSHHPLRASSSATHWRSSATPCWWWSECSWRQLEMGWWEHWRRWAWTALLLGWKDRRQLNSTCWFNNNKNISSPFNRSCFLAFQLYRVKNINMWQINN